VNNGTTRKVTLNDLAANTTYYWQVRANGYYGTTYANGTESARWMFRTGGVPGGFGKSSPASGVGGQSTGVRLYWSGSSGAVSYAYCLGTSAVGCTNWVSTNTSTSVGLTGLEPNTTYYWQVRATNSFGETYANGAEAVRWSFSTGGAPGAFNKSSPSNLVSGQNANVRLYWSGSSGATTYQYCLGTSAESCTNWVSAGTSTSVGLTGLAVNTTYYWQVRATNGFGTEYANGAEAAHWSFSTGGAPGAFNKSSPSNLASGQNANVRLYWNGSSGAATYQYCVGTSAESCTSWVSAGTSTSVSLTNLSANTQYYWQVRGTNSFGTTYANGGAGEVWSFTTAGVPGMFNKSSPGNGASGLSSRVVLYWSGSSGAATYQYCVGTSAGGCTNWMSNGTSTSVSLTSLSENTTYYWQVRGTNSFGEAYANGGAGEVWSFSTGGAPGAFSKSSPSNGAVGQSSSLTLYWSGSSGVATYQYCLGTSAAGCTSWVSAGTSTSVSVTGLAANTQYYWQVRATNGFGETYANGGAGEVWSFSTGSVPGAFSKSSPSNGADGQSSRVVLYWSGSSGVTKYQYCLGTSAAGCTSWVSAGKATSVTLTGLLPNSTYYWQVRATNGVGTIYANGAQTDLWTFTTAP
jgi:phosphodiesterase/alkaline phosphatase D-like protein